MTVAAILVLTSCLILLGVFYLLMVNLQVNLDKLQLLNEIVVFVDPSLSQDEVDDIGSDLRTMDNVKYVEYTSKTEGFASMKGEYPEYSELFDEIEENGDNPLSDRFTVTYRDNSKVYELEYALRAIPGVTKVNNRADYAAKVEQFKNGMSAVFLWLLILLFAVSLFVIFNTIKLAVHGRKAEITVMRYIGATRGFIIAPFVLEGGLIGTVSAAAAFFAVQGLYGYVAEKLSADLQMITFEAFADYRLTVIIAFIAIGILSGVLTSLLSLSKSLKK